jgi:hypothetical protein
MAEASETVIWTGIAILIIIIIIIIIVFHFVIKFYTILEPPVALWHWGRLNL